MPLLGVKNYIARMRRLYSPEVQEAIGQALFEVADAIKAEAQISINRAKHGRLVKGKRRKQYVASAPGEPPAYDTEVLRARIIAERTGKTKAEVRSEAPYSAALEFGTSRMSARPFLRPARDKLKPTLEKVAKAKIEAVIRRG